MSEQQPVLIDEIRMLFNYHIAPELNDKGSDRIRNELSRRTSNDDANLAELAGMMMVLRDSGIPPSDVKGCESVLSSTKLSAQTEEWKEIIRLSSSSVVAASPKISLGKILQAGIPLYACICWDATAEGAALSVAVLMFPRVAVVEGRDRLKTIKLIDEFEEGNSHLPGTRSYPTLSDMMEMITDAERESVFLSSSENGLKQRLEECIEYLQRKDILQERNAGGRTKYLLTS